MEAVRHAAAEIPAEVNERLDAAKKLSEEDRMTIIDIARAALGEYLPAPDNDSEQESGNDQNPESKQKS